MVAALVACKNDPVSNLNAPVVGPIPAAIQDRVKGLFGVQRVDFGTRVTALDAFARNAANFVTTDNRYITEWLGDGAPIGNSDFYGGSNWAQSFITVRQANGIMQDLPNVKPAYSAGDLAKAMGIVQTIKAYAYMLAAETRDTLGVPIHGPDEADPTQPAPILCARDAWQYIVAQLDSANAHLNVDTSMGIPFQLIPGAAAVSARAAPSTAVGAFAGFNRALAAKAGLELAYAIARSPGGTPPTPTTPGAPDLTALTRADSALHASFLYNPSALSAQTAGDFSEALAVYQSFTGASGDLANPMQAQITSYYVLKEALADIDPSDGRLAKLIPNPGGAAQTAYATKATGLALGMYQTVASPMPIIRNEELNLIEAQIRLGLGDFAGADAAINAVRTHVAGLPVVNPAGYTAVRDQILKELRASTIGEPGGDRAIAIRNYGVQLASTTTWGSVDTHATLQPLPVSEVDARAGKTGFTCP
jgi:starch-binding outer membrane protein, SusD/RagB family